MWERSRDISRLGLSMTAAMNQKDRARVTLKA